MTNHKLKMWWETARPKTLPLALASIFTGSALAYWADKESFNLTVMLLCLLTTILLQVLSNFANDYGDHQKGSDTEERIGPLRGIQQGAISANELKWGLILMAVGSFFSGAFLIGIAYQSLTDLLVFAGLGILAIIAAITYTVGAKPYGYLGLGDLSVLLFFGLLGVGGTYYLQTHSIDSLIILPALGSGLLATAVLNINNLRDIEQDAKVGKKYSGCAYWPEERTYLSLYFIKRCRFMLCAICGLNSIQPLAFLIFIGISIVIKTRIICLSQQRARSVASDVGTDVNDFFIYQYLV